MQWLAGGEVLLGLGSVTVYTVVSLCCGVALLHTVDVVKERAAFRRWYFRSSALRLASYALLFYAILFLGEFRNQEFIYFQF